MYYYILELMLDNHLLFTVTPKTNINDTYIYKSLTRISVTPNFRYKTSNKTGLSTVYNQVLNEYSQKYNYIHFIHDDAEILDDWKRVCTEIEQHKDWGIIGVAGATNKIQIKYPTLWHLMSDRKDYRGAIAHFTEDKQYYHTSFGEKPYQCVVIDGVYMCVNCKLIKNWRFNENFTFHHYDIASCIDALHQGIKIGVANINLAHASPGLRSLDDVEWKKSNDKFLKLYTKTS